MTCCAISARPYASASPVGSPFNVAVAAAATSPSHSVISGRALGGAVVGRGLHSSTFQLNLSRFVTDRLTPPRVSHKKCLR